MFDSTRSLPIAWAWLMFKVPENSTVLSMILDVDGFKVAENKKTLSTILPWEGFSVAEKFTGLLTSRLWLGFRVEARLTSLAELRAEAKVFRVPVRSSYMTPHTA